MKRLKGFTLVELVITIAIVIILSVISVPIYRGYVDKAKMAEVYALAGTILSAQKNYYSEYGYFYFLGPNYYWTSNNIDLGIDIRGNKYFTSFFTTAHNLDMAKYKFYSYIMKPTEIQEPGKRVFGFNYNITEGIRFVDRDDTGNE